jgi:hypothetical protein
MKANYSRYQIIRMVVIIGLIPVSVAIQGNTLMNSVYANNLCLGPLACSAVGGSGGHGGNTGDAISGDIGPGGSCFAKYHVTIGDECGGSTGSSEPRSGSGDHSMNGGMGGEAHNTVRN